MKKNQYDILIVGGGLVGLTLAALLADSKFRIAVIDKASFAEHSPTAEWDTRVSAITCASQRILQRLNVWPMIAKEKIALFRKMHVWDATEFGSIDFDSAEIGEPTLGYIVENCALQTALYQKCKACSNITFVDSAVTRLNIENNHATLQLNDEHVLTAKLVVGADGAESKIRQCAEIQIKTWDYGHSALVCNVQTSLAHQQTAWQRFLADGPLAFLPLAQPQECSIVWSTQPDEAQRLQQLTENEFKTTLAEAFAYRLGSIEVISKRVIFPLRMRHAEHYVKPSLALIGDAAHTIHPLAGQGVNLGLLDAACLAEVILNENAKGRPIGSIATLRKYERWRKGENLLMLAMVEGIKQAFSQEKTLLRKVVNIGLQATDQLQILKNYLMHRARGSKGDLPQVAL